MTPSNNEQGRWWAGVAGKAALAVSAMALCASAAVAGVGVESPKAAVAAASSESMVGKGPQVQTPGQAMGTMIIQTTGLAVSFDAKAGDALRASLSRHKGLPDARIVIARQAIGDDGSRMLYDKADNSCQIAIAVSAKGLGTIADDLPRSLGINPGSALASRLLDIEATHELGHCLSHQLHMGFAHPALGAQENQGLAMILPGSALGDVWEESFADAYAMLTRMSEAKTPAASAQALGDLRLLKAWRESDREAKQAASKSGDKIPMSHGHATEATLAELERDPAGWRDAPGSVAERSARLASIGTARAAKASVDPTLMARESLDLDARFDKTTRMFVDALAESAFIDAMGASMMKGDLAAAEGSFAKKSARMVEAAARFSGDPFIPMAMRHIDQIARTVFKEGLRVQDPKYAMSEKTGMRDLRDSIYARLAAEGTLAQIKSEMPADVREGVAKAGLALWDKVIASEGSAPSSTLPAKASGALVAKAFVDDREASLVKASLEREPAMDLGGWRSKRAIQPEAPKAPSRAPTP